MLGFALYASACFSELNFCVITLVLYVFSCQVFFSYSDDLVSERDLYLPLRHNDSESNTFSFSYQCPDMALMRAFYNDLGSVQKDLFAVDSSSYGAMLGESFYLSDERKKDVDLTQSVSGEEVGYVGIVTRACLSRKEFSMFKRQARYRDILEHTSVAHGQAYVSHIQLLAPHLFRYIGQFKMNDNLGGPVIIHDYGIDVGWITPSTLRYMAVLADLYYIFGDLTNFDILEIGGGYGGEALTIQTVYDVRSYLIIDLPEVLALISRYLDNFPFAKRKMLFADYSHGTPAVISDRKKKTYDLCISNYAFSELGDKLQKLYWNTALQYCERGYFTDNSEAFGKSFHVDAEFLKNSRKKKVFVVSEAQWMQDSDIGNNDIVVWK